VSNLDWLGGRMVAPTNVSHLSDTMQGLLIRPVEFAVLD
jgi:hypothetical protein